MRLGLRPYKPCDAAAAVSWAESGRTLRLWTADRFADCPWPLPPERLNAYYRQFDGTDDVFPMTAFEADGRAVGHLLLRWPDPGDRGTVRLGFVLVDPARRGTGLGRELAALAVQYARRFLGAERVTLGVFADNAAARRCYEAAGFLPVGETACAIGGETWPCVEMEWNEEARANAR